MKAAVARTIAAVLLLVVGEARAECAWVLWNENTLAEFSYKTADAKVPGGKHDQKETSSWKIIASFDTRSACDQKQSSQIKATVDLWRIIQSRVEAAGGKAGVFHPPDSDTVTMRTEMGGERTTTLMEFARYLCLPDGVDPRGPRVK